MAIQEIVIQGVPFERADALNVLKQIKASGATAVQIYVNWKYIEPHAEGAFVWDTFDAQVRLIKEAGLKWVLFLPMGPKYSHPDWWMRDPRHQGIVCLEHGRENPTESIWNPQFRPQIRRVLKALAEHYLPWDIIQSVQVGLTGDYGESIMPMQGNWPGDYHTHGGYWSGDPYAVASFRETMQAKFGTIEALNEAWNSRYADFASLRPFMPYQATSRTALYDMLGWYKDSMTEFVDFWMEESRRCFPETPLYLCTGGIEDPRQASDFAAQVKVCAKYNAGVRLTNEESRFCNNFFLTSLTHAACEQYGAYLGLEPASYVSHYGVGSRMFGSAVYGNRQMMFYYYNLFCNPEENGSILTEKSERFTEYLPLLNERKMSCEVALFWSQTMGVFGGGFPPEVQRLSNFLRCYTNVMMVNERMVKEGGLDRFKLLVIPPMECGDREALEAIAAWVKRGGKAVAFGTTPDIEYRPISEYDEVFGILPESEMGMGDAVYHVADKRFSRLAEQDHYVSPRGMLGLHPDTIEIVRCDYIANTTFDMTQAAMANVFMREYPSGGAAIMYVGLLHFEFDPQGVAHRQPVIVNLLRDLLDTYTDSKPFEVGEGEEARGYINGALYALRDDGNVVKIEE